MHFPSKVGSGYGKQVKQLEEFAEASLDAESVVNAFDASNVATVALNIDGKALNSSLKVITVVVMKRKRNLKLMINLQLIDYP